MPRADGLNSTRHPCSPHSVSSISNISFHVFLGGKHCFLSITRVRTHFFKLPHKLLWSIPWSLFWRAADRNAFPSEVHRFGSFWHVVVYPHSEKDTVIETSSSSSFNIFSTGILINTGQLWKQAAKKVVRLTCVPIHQGHGEAKVVHCRLDEKMRRPMVLEELPLAAKWTRWDNVNFRKVSLYSCQFSSAIQSVRKSTFQL